MEVDQAEQGTGSLLAVIEGFVPVLGEDQEEWFRFSECVRLYCHRKDRDMPALGKALHRLSARTDREGDEEGMPGLSREARRYIRPLFDLFLDYS